VATKSLGTLTLDMVLRNGNYVQGMNQAERATVKAARQIKQEMDIAKAAVAAFAIGAVAATARAVKASIDHSAALHDQSQALGFATEDLSAYEFGLKQVGVTSEQLTTSLARFNKSVADDSDAFKQLGIDIHDANGDLKSNAVLLEAVADAFQKMENGAIKASIAQQLLGRSGGALIPFLNEGRAGIRAMTEEADNFGQVISSETAALADKFGDNLQKIADASSGVGNAIAAGALPTLVDLTDEINDPENQEGMRVFNNRLELIIATIGELVSLKPLRDIFGGLDSGSSLTGVVDRTTGPATPALTDDQLEAIEAGDKLIKQQQERIALIGKTTESAKLAAQIELGMYAELSDAQLDQLQMNAQLEDSEIARVAALEKTRQESQAAQDAENARLEAVQEGFAASQAALAREIETYGLVTQEAIFRAEVELGYYADIDTASIERQASLLAEKDAMDEAAIAAEKLADLQQSDEELTTRLQAEIDLYGVTSEAVIYRYEVEHGLREAATDANADYIEGLYQQITVLDEITEAEKERQKEIARAQDELARNTQGIIADFLKGTFDDGLKGAFDRFKTMLADMAAEAVAADIMKKIIGFGQGSGSSGGSGWGAALATFAGLFDSGGMIPAGQWGIAGENGAEIIRGPANITSTKDTAAMMGRDAPVTNNYNVILPNARTKQEGDEAGSAFARRQNRMNSGSGRYQ
jgi:hypothetical protein